MGKVWYFRWADVKRSHGMPTPEECEEEGYEMVGYNPRFPNSILLRKDVIDED